jgi:hypothetical protein
MQAKGIDFAFGLISDGSMVCIAKANGLLT